MNKDVDLLYELGCFRFIQRTWKHFLNVDFANVAEHTLRVIWIALLIARREEENGVNIDYSKLMLMALVHDLPESRTGDHNFIQAQYNNSSENQALAEILKDTSFTDLHKIWQDCKERSSIEAKIVKDADILDVDLELREQSVKGVTFPDGWQKVRDYSYEEKLFTKTAKILWKEIYKKNPFCWNENIMNKYLIDK